jgi:hypothetical protein
VRISNDLGQITDIKNQYLDENIKKGWEVAWHVYLSICEAFKPDKSLF